MKLYVIVDSRHGPVLEFYSFEETEYYLRMGPRYSCYEYNENYGEYIIGSKFTYENDKLITYPEGTWQVPLGYTVHTIATLCIQCKLMNCFTGEHVCVFCSECERCNKKYADCRCGFTDY